MHGQKAGQGGSEVQQHLERLYSRIREAQRNMFTLCTPMDAERYCVAIV